MEFKIIQTLQYLSHVSFKRFLTKDIFLRFVIIKGLDKMFNCQFCVFAYWLYRVLMYEGQSKITEPYFITFDSSKMGIYLDDISL